MKVQNTRCLFLLLAMVLMLSAGCGSSKEAPPPDTEVVRKELMDKTWICESMLGRKITGDTDLTLTFLADNKVKGHGGCNDFAGSYVLAADKLTLESLVATKKACSAFAMEQEFTYLSLLQRVTQVKVEGSELELYVDTHPEPIAFSTSGGGGLFW